MKPLLLTVVLFFALDSTVQAQFKEVAQLATLSPVILVATNDNLEDYLKLHYTVSSMVYLGSYIITDSIWKSAVITLALGLSKELIYDGLFGKGEPLLEDMIWNSLGTAQGAVFTLSFKI